MTTSKVSPIRPVESPAAPDEFGALMQRFLVAHARLEIIMKALGDFSDLPDDLACVGTVLQETTEDLDQVYNDLDGWAVKRTHTPKETGESHG